MTLQAFITKYRVTMTAELTDRNPNMDDDKWTREATHWKCHLQCGRRSMVVYFSQGAAISHEPSTADILDTLGGDAASWENAGSFEEWCSEYGYDTDSRRAERTYKAIERQSADLARILPVEGYDALLWHTERQ